MTTTMTDAAERALARGDVAAAETAFRDRLARDRADGAAWAGLARIAAITGRIDLADRLFAQACAAAPADGGEAALWSDASAAAQGVGDAGRADRLARAALALDPAAARNWLRRAMAALQNRDLVTARTAFGRATDLDWDLGQAWLGLAACRADTGLRAAAAGDFRRGLALTPADPAGWHQFGDNLLEGFEPAAAVRAYAHALALRPDDARARLSWGEEALLQGAIGPGFAAYEARWAAWGTAAPLPTDLPPWRGEPLGGGTLLLVGEQGNGDNIFFARFLRGVLARGLAARIVLIVLPSLDRVMRAMFAGLPVDIVAVDDKLGVARDRIGAVVAVAAIGSLPHLLGVTDPAADSSPYLPWPRPAGATTGRHRVGLVWGGNPGFVRDAERSPGLRPLAPLFDVAGIDWTILQAGARRADLDAWGSALPPGSRDLGAGFGDFADCAAAMAGLDLVVTSCTGPLHLAAAMGLPVWALINARPDWRWIRGRDDSPWYPTLRLFRQTRPGDWSAPVAGLKSALQSLVG